jgi:membrane-associated phospholipid phosphatase
MKSSPAFTRKYFRKLPFSLVVLLICFIGALFLFSFIIHEVLWEKETAMDDAVFDYLSARVIDERFTGFMKTVTFMGAARFLQIAFALLVISYLVKNNRKRAIEIAAIGIGGFLITYVMKLSFQRVRPSGPLIEPLTNFSFPSGHATSGFIFYGLLIYLIWKGGMRVSYKYILSVILVLIALLIGFSRVYLRLHYFSDVLAGFCIGFAWLSLSIWLFQKLKERSDDDIQRSR